MNHERALVLDLLGNVSRNQGSTLNDNFPSYFPPHLIIRGGGKQVGKFLFPLGDIICKKTGPWPWIDHPALLEST